jgi:hypothetical protein
MNGLTYSRLRAIEKRDAHNRYTGWIGGRGNRVPALMIKIQ